MSSAHLAPSIRIKFDPLNPGQFFACCGLLELANRFWGAAEGGFDNGEFHLTAVGESNISLDYLLGAVLESELAPLDPAEPATSPLLLKGKFKLRLDWWRDEAGGGSRFKTWAGQQKVVGIATAMHRALQRAMRFGPDLFGFGEVLPDPDEPKRSVAPFYFDARRAAGAHNLDIGFSSDALKINTLSFPAVEFLCLVGLQRFRARESDDRTFVYHTWPVDRPLEPAIAAAAACGACPIAGCRTYRFRFLFRTKYLKGFLPAVPDGGDE